MQLDGQAPVGEHEPIDVRPWDALGLDPARDQDVLLTEHHPHPRGSEGDERRQRGTAETDEFVLGLVPGQPAVDQDERDQGPRDGAGQLLHPQRGKGLGLLGHATDCPGSGPTARARCVRTRASDLVSGVVLEFGEPRGLDLAPGLVGVPAPPVRRDRDVRPRKAPLMEQVFAQGPVADGLPVHERLRPPLRSGELAQGVDEQFRVAGGVRPVQPAQVQVGGGLQRELVVGPVHLDEHVRDGTRGQDRQRGRDRGQGALVADEQMPVGVGVGSVPAARPAERQDIAGLGVARPRSRDAAVPVHHEVQGQHAGRGVPGAHGVPARARALVGGQRLGGGRVEVRRVGPIRASGSTR